MMIIIMKEMNALKTHTYEPSTQPNPLHFVKGRKKNLLLSFNTLNIHTEIENMHRC